MDKTSPREILLGYGKWIGASDFAELIAEKRNVSERQAKTYISKAYRKTQIKKFIFPDRTVIYGLAEFGPPTNEASSGLQSKSDVENVRKALEEKRYEFAFFKEPTVKEVATQVGMPPRKVEPILYSLAHETGWSEPDENAEKDAKDAINLAIWLKAEEKGKVTAELKPMVEKTKAKASNDVQKRAKNILNQYPELVSSVNMDRVTWPDHTKAKWYQVFRTEAPAPIQPSEGVGIAFPNQDGEKKGFEQNRKLF